MRILSQNRRKNRSENILDALGYQLAASAKRAKFSAMVLADNNGLVIADTGDTGMCEEMAALSPVLARNRKPWHGPVNTEIGSVRLTVAPIRVQDMQFYLSASEGKEAHLISREMVTSGQGVNRILH